MSLSSACKIADAIVTELNDPIRNWSQAFKAERVWFTRKASKDLKVLEATVMVSETQQALYSRGHRQREHKIFITFRKNVDQKNKDAVDALVSFVETVADFYGANAVEMGARKIAGTQAIVTQVLNEPILSSEDLDVNGRFQSYLILMITEVVKIADAQLVRADEDEDDPELDGGAAEIIELINTDEDPLPPFAGAPDPGGYETHSELVTVEAGLLVLVLYIFGRSGSAATTVVYGSDDDGVGSTPLTEDASVPFTSGSTTGTLKVFSVPVQPGFGFLRVDLNGDTAYLAGSPLNITGLASNAKGTVNIADDDGVPSEPTCAASAASASEAVVAAFIMQSSDTTWTWINNYTGGKNYTSDFAGEYENFRAAAGWRLAGTAGTFTAGVTGITPTQWAGCTVTYK